jgi:diaminohydroxyphosphoribosylaminopyrimidine deaminase/5-amino-6-(5-phosphoribosylamino)uracil reductase
MSFSLADHEFMAKAIKLAQRGQFTTSPNPNVGCVIVKNNEIIGEGWHKKAGTGHAEVNALANLTAEQTTDATAYVTLEPCSHFGRTPPCANQLIDANIKRVVVAMLDPNPLVAGKGILLLMQAGVDVKLGLLELDARALNLGFLSRMETKRPFVSVKMASSLDGKSALGNGQSKWITGAEARADVQTYRAKACAILSTATTVIADNAKLNVRAEQLNFSYPFDDVVKEIRQPIKIILDSRGDLDDKRQSELALFDGKESTVSGTSIIIVRKDSDELPASAHNNVSYVQLPYDEASNRFAIDALLDWCGKNEINNLWVEAGAKLAASFVEQILFDQLIVYIAPKIMGMNAQDVMPVGPFDAMEQTIELQLKTLTQLGQDMRLSYVNKSYVKKVAVKAVDIKESEE